MDRFIMQCQCIGNCGSIHFIKFHEDGMTELYLEYHQEISSSLYKGPLHIVVDRIKQCIAILRGKGFLLYGIVVDDKSLAGFRDWLNSNQEA